MDNRQVEYYPLTHPQKGIWNIERVYSGTGIANIAATITAGNDICLDILEKAINIFIEHNDGMRLRITERAEAVVQYVSEYKYEKLIIMDFRGKPEEELLAWEDRETRTPFKIEDELLYQFVLLILNERERGFYFKLHHLISDGWTSAFVINKVFEYYQLMKNGGKVFVKDSSSYLEYIQKEMEYTKGDKFQKDREFWRDKFKDFTETTFLKERSFGFISTEAARKSYVLENTLSEKLKKYCAENRKSEYAVLLACLFSYICKVTQKNDITIGTPVLNRANEREKNTAGMFINTVPIRLLIEEGDTLEHLVNRISRELLSIFRHQRYPFDVLQEEVRAGTNIKAIHDIAFSFQNIRKQDGISNKWKWIFTGEETNSLTLHVNERENNGIVFDFDYLNAVFNEKEIDTAYGHLVTILDHTLECPSKPISQIEMMTPEEKEWILHKFNGTDAEYPRDKTIHQLFEAQAEKTPGSIAVIFEKERLTYRELNERANQLARVLREKAVQPDTIVGIMAERSPEMIVGILGIMKAGGAYLPIDPGYPRDRIGYMLEDSGASVLVMGNGQWVIGNEKNMTVIQLDDERIYGGDGANLEPVSKPEDLAYVIYTSGSTGKPKGVMVTNRGLVNYIWWARKTYLDNNEVFSFHSSIAFDLTVTSVFSPLISGNTIKVFGEEENETVIEKVFKDPEVTITKLTPSHLGLLEKSDLKVPEKGMKYIVGGEDLKTETAKRVYEKYKGKVEIFNEYGPTETVVGCMVYRYDYGKDVKKSVPIGKPGDNVKIYIVNKENMPAPTGVAGELCIAGDGLARGYLNRPELTAEKFVPNPFSNGQRMYRTGDLARWMPDGNIEFLGRIDHQVKIRGYRIEPGEIEAALVKVAGIKEAVVLEREDNDSGKYLCAYVVSRHTAESAEIRQKLMKVLPEYMVPAHFVHLESIPLNRNGKIDRKALLDIKITVESKKYQAPENVTEEKLVKIWNEVLGVERIGIRDSFFELGGHSLKAAVLKGKIHKEFNIELTLKEIFNRQTIKEQADYIRGAAKGTYQTIAPVEEKEYYPISAAQKRMYILNQVDRDSTAYNMPDAQIIDGPLDKDYFEDVFRQLIRRHEALRTSFEMVDGEPVQRVHREVDFKIDHVHVDREEEAEAKIKAFIRPFDLEKAPLLRVSLIELPGERHVFLCDMHHIISDGTSSSVLTGDFAKLYRQQALPALKIQYKDFSQWQNEMIRAGELKKQEEYWLMAFSDEIPVLTIPADCKRPETQTFKGHRVKASIPGAVAGKMDALARERKTTLNTFAFSAYSLLISKYTGQNDMVIGSTVAGRNHSELEGIMGIFANFLPVRVRIDPRNSFRDTMDSLRETLLEAYENQEYPFDLIVEKMGSRIDRSRNPLFDTMLIFHNEFGNMGFGGQDMGDLKFSPCEVERNTAALDFKLDIYPNPAGELECLLEYNTDLFAEATMKDFLNHFLMLIAQVVEKPSLKVSEIELFDAEEKQKLEQKRKAACKGPQALDVAIAATFTAEPVEEYIHWWCGQFEHNVQVKFAPYNQVFQELLNPFSTISRNKGINVLLVRFEDWLRDDFSEDVFKIEKLERNFNEIIGLIKDKEKTNPFFIGVFPGSTHLNLGEEVKESLETLNKRWKTFLEGCENTYLLDFTALARRYEISEVFDYIKDTAGHLPFTDEYYAAMGTEIARKICALRKQPFKVIVLDCDNTLWKGVCGEDGAQGITVDDGYLKLQEFMLQKRSEGFLLALCSKNNEADVWEVFEKNNRMRLQKEHLSAWRINWKSKPENIVELAKELNLGCDSFIFIDDSPAECSGMMVNRPEVLSLQLPEDSTQIPAFLDHGWALDKIKVTDEDKTRAEMYGMERKRREIQEEAANFNAFIKSLHIKMSMTLMEAAQVDRAAQLTQRTNQFNLSTIRRTSEEMQVLLQKPHMRCRVVEVSDRFGDYGLAGVVVTEENNGSLFIETLLLSCRVLGKKIEDAILHTLGKYCESKSIEKMTARFYPTPKNTPLLEFIERAGWKEVERKESYTEYSMDVSSLPPWEGHVDCYLDSSYEKENRTGAKTTVIQSAVSSENDEGGIGKRKQDWEVNTVNEDKLLHKSFLLPLLHSSAGKLLMLPVQGLQKHKIREAPYQVPGNEIEVRMLNLWEEVLKLEGIGINDNFFELGGHSLRAATLVSRIHKAFHVQIQLKDVFINPTVKGLAGLVRNAAESLYSSIVPVEEKEYYPVSAAQRRMYILHRMDRENTVYNMPGAQILEGRLEKKRLEEALKQLVRRHEALRTSFEMVDGEPVQKIHREADFQITYLKAEKEKEVEALIKELIRPFDLSRAPLFRVSLIEVADDKHIMVYDMHHIISDGTSMSLLVSEFARLYNGQALPPLRLQYRDFSGWQNALFKSGKIKKQEEYWLKTFEGEVPVLEMPTDFQRPAVQSYEGERVRFEAGRELKKKLSRLAWETGTTMYMVLLAAYNVLLAKYSGQEDIIIGSPVAGRTHADLENIMGMFVSTLALRNYPGSRKPFRKFLQEVRENALKAYENQDYPFDFLVEQLELKRDLSRNPVFDVMFAMQNMDMGRFTLPEMQISPLEYENGISKFDLTLQAAESEDSITFELEYCGRLFRKATVERLAGHYLNILAYISEKSHAAIRDIDMLSASEKDQILHAFNRTKAAYPGEKTVYRLFEEQAARNPDNIAVVFEDKQLSYKELNGKANSLAGLLREKGVGPEAVVGIMTQVSLEMIIGILGVLKAGGAYLPLSPENPGERIEHMLADSKAAILLTHSPVASKVDFDGEVILLDDESIYIKENGNLTAVNKPSDAAYIIYTSGTTGRPKGVVIEHQSFSRTIQWRKDAYGLGEQDAVLQLFSFAFDGFITSFFTPVIAGSKAVLLKEESTKDPLAIKRNIAQHRITHFISVPVLYSALLDDITPEEARSLRIVTLAGDSFDGRLVERSKQISSETEIVNEYGPTEATVVSTIARNIQPGEAVTIGKPAAGTRIYLLDREGQPQPIGVAGEICIGGSRLARGYLNRPELTAERFADNLFIPGERIYRTGDLGRWLPDGNIEFLGRMDHQVKIRGYRVELGEIESRLLEVEGISQAAVIARDGQNGAKYLCAYITSGKALAVSGLREYLSRQLPDYMIPSFFVRVDKIPLTASGKIDRRALPEPDNSGNENEYEAPGNETERTMAEVWESVLNAKSVGVNDNFFALGGDSIKAIQVASRLGKYGMNIEINDIFKHQVIRELSKVVKTSGGNIAQGPVEGDVELTPIQRWFFEEIKENNRCFNHAVMLYREEGFNEKYVRDVFREIVVHHDALRMVYELGEEVLQKNRGIDEKLFDMEVIDLRNEDKAEEIVLRNANRLQGSMDLEKGPLVKLAIFKTGKGDHLLIVIHHLVVDGVSWRVILEDLSAGYRLAEEHAEIKLPAKTSPYKAWAEKLKEYADNWKLLKEKEYWSALEQAEVKELPKDPIEKGGPNDIGILSSTITKEDTEKLLGKINHVYNTEINDVLLTALAGAVKDWTGEGRVLVTLEGHGREGIIKGMNITRTVGWFTSMYPVLLDLGDTDELSHQLVRIKESIRRIPNKGIGYGIIKYLTGKENKEGLAFTAKPRISFNYFGQLDRDVNTEVFKISHLSTGNNNIKRPDAIEINAVIINESLTISVAYESNDYKEETIRVFLENWKRHLSRIINHCMEKEEVELTPSDAGCNELNVEEFNDLATYIRDEVCKKKGSAIEKVYRLTPMQEGMLFHALAEKSNAYFEQMTVNIRGRLETDVLEEALNRIIARHHVFRTVFRYSGVRNPVQVVLKERKVNLQYEDISDKNQEEIVTYIEALKCKDREKGFDLTRDMLMRVSVIKTGEKRYVLVWSFHHIIMDGWCFGIVMDELLKQYASIRDGREAQLGEVTQYGEYIAWLKEQNEQEAIAYWKQYLEGYEEQADIPKYKKMNMGDGYKQEKAEIILDREETQTLEEIARKNHVTLNTLAETIWGLLLQNYNGKNDVVFGKVVSGRTLEVAGIETMVGLFINAVPVRVIKKENESFAEMLKRQQESSLAGSKYEHSPLAQIQAESLLKQNLISHIMIFENYPISESVKKLNNGELGFEITEIHVFEQTNYDFAITVIPGKELTLRLDYNGNVYGREILDGIKGHWEACVKKIIANPHIEAQDIDILPEEERTRVLYTFNDTKAGYPKEKTIHQLFEEQVERTPDSTAVVFRDRKLTYRELNEKSNSLARVLREKGVKVNDIVGIMAERSLEMMVGLMGILKAGGAYLPIDPEYPGERKAYMLEDSGAEILVMGHGQWVIGDGKPMTVIHSQEESLYDRDGPNLEHINTSGDLAYVIYTSGSTGKPKGVAVEHGSVVNRLNWMQKKYPIGLGDVILQKTPYTFDVSVWELFWWSITGSGVCLLEPGGEKDAESIVNAVNKNRVTVMHFVPSMLNAFLEYLDKTESGSRLGSLKKIFASGEALALQQVDEFNRLVRGRGVSLHNLYGPTEATVDVTYYDCGEAGGLSSVPIGKPIDNTRIYILDTGMKPVPVGVTGELYIAGDGVARGYIGKPELTNEKFIAEPFVQDGRMYRSGDLARWLPDGNIEYLGRIDNQVKLRGFRIELGEIESCILKHCEIKEAAVVALNGADGSRQLCAYFTSDRKIPAPELKEHIAAWLPHYMVPAYFCQLDTMPLTSSGKINRKALPAPGTGLDSRTEYTAPRNEREEKLAAVWQEVLGIEQVGIHDNFFERGGDSIKAIQVSSRLTRFGLALEIKNLFKHPRISELGAWLKETGRKAYQGVVEGEAILTPVQRRFFEKPMKERHHFNHAVMLYKKDGFNDEALGRVLEKIVAHHDALRMVFREEGTSVIQYNRGLQGKALDIRVVNPEAIGEDAEKTQGSIDLKDGPLFKAVLYKTPQGDHLLLVIHHLVVDGVSWRILLEDITAGYEQALRNEEITLPEKTDSYKRWGEKLLEYANSSQLAKEADYWKRLGVLQIKPLPRDFDAQGINHAADDTVNMELSEKDTGLLLNKVNLAYNTEINDILLTALGMAVSDWNGEDKVAISLEGHGREEIIKEIDIKRTVGWFTAMYPVVLDMSREKDMGYRIKSVKEELRRIPNKGVGYGILKYMSGAGGSLGPEPEISFNYLGQFDREVNTALAEVSGISPGKSVGDGNERLFAVDINGMIAGGRLTMAFSYSTRQYKKESIERLTRRFTEFLTCIIDHCTGKKSVEYTPNDFSGKDLSMDELEEIFEAFDSD